MSQPSLQAAPLASRRRASQRTRCPPEEPEAASRIPSAGDRSTSAWATTPRPPPETSFRHSTFQLHSVATGSVPRCDAPHGRAAVWRTPSQSRSLGDRLKRPGFCGGSDVPRGASRQQRGRCIRRACPFVEPHDKPPPYRGPQKHLSGTADIDRDSAISNQPAHGRPDNQCNDEHSTKQT